MLILERARVDSLALEKTLRTRRPSVDGFKVESKLNVQQASQRVVVNQYGIDDVHEAGPRKVNDTRRYAYTDSRQRWRRAPRVQR